MSDLGRACLIEIGCNSTWRARCRNKCNMINLIWSGDVSVDGLDRLGINVNEKNMTES